MVSSLVNTEKRSELYYNAYWRKLDKMIVENKVPEGTELMSLVFMGVKSYLTNRETQPKTLETLEARFSGMELLKSFMTMLTPDQFINTFPIRKEYDGDKYESKDYFFTIDMVRKLEPSKPIGSKIDDFLWDYMNFDISIFQVELFSVVDDIARAQGMPSALERMSADLGMPIYYSDSKRKYMTGPIQVKKIGNEYSYDEKNAKTVKIKKPIPHYLKVVK